MVLCKYFQQGNCRFGAKCQNEHFDVKQIIKTDVEAALNGNQWPLSCFGPFKDKPCIPNFIEDQCYEEIRFLCYESKQKNFFQQFHQQFTKEVLEAKNKMKALLQLSPDIVDVVTKVYDAPTETAAVGTKTNNNPFGMMTANGTSAASIFGKPAGAATANNVFGGGGNGMFGSTAVATNAFAAQQPAAAASTFGQQQSIFGQQATQTNSIFGGGVQQPNFGQAGQNPAVAGGGIFAQALKPQSTIAPTGLFAQAAQQTAQQPGFGIFAQAAQQTAPTFQQQQQQQQNPFGQQQGAQQPGGIFAQAMQQPQPIPSGGNIFAQQQQQQQQQQQHQQQQQQHQQQQQQQHQQQQQQLQGGIFANAVQQSQNMQQQQQQQPPGSNIFAQAAQQTQPPSAGGFFQQTPQQQQQPQPAFMQPNQLLTAAPPTPQLGIANASIYSRMEDLTAEEIEAFKADSFSVGKIPFSPPPRELVN